MSQLFKAQWDFKLPEEFEIDFIFLRKQRFYRFQTFFKDSLCLEKFTNVDTKGAKWSVKIWATNCYKSFFLNVLLYMNGRLSKIRSYVWSKVDSCFCEGLYNKSHELFRFSVLLLLSLTQISIGPFGSLLSIVSRACYLTKKYLQPFVSF